MLKIVIFISNVNPFELKFQTAHKVDNSIHKWRLFNLSWCFLLFLLFRFLYLFLQFLHLLLSLSSSFLLIFFFLPLYFFLSPLVHFYNVIDWITFIITTNVIVIVLLLIYLLSHLPILLRHGKYLAQLWRAHHQQSL